MIELKVCPACDRPVSESRRVGVYGKASRFGEESLPNRTTVLFRCRCGHAYNNPQLSTEELRPFYSGHYHVYRDPMITPEEVAREVRAASDGRCRRVPVKRGGRYVDIGCGRGDMVALLKAAGMQAQGVELSPVAAKLASERGLEVFCGTLEQAAFADGTFDSMSMFHVLEHVHDPVALLRECRRVLRPGCEMLIVVPNADSAVFALVGDLWTGLDVPRHLHHFSPASLAIVANRAGLEIADLTTEALDGAVESELRAWARRRLYIPARLTAWTGWLRPLSRRIARSANETGRGEVVIATLRRPAQEASAAA